MEWKVRISRATCRCLYLDIESNRLYRSYFTKKRNCNFNKMKKIFFLIINYSFLIFNSPDTFAQLKWINVDSQYQPLPKSVHIYFTNEPIDTSPFRAFYL